MRNKKEGKNKVRAIMKRELKDWRIMMRIKIKDKS